MEKGKKKGLVERAYESRRGLYMLFIVVCALPIVFPIVLPVTIDPMTRDVYNYVEGLPSGSSVALFYGIDAAMYKDMEPASIALITHILRRPLKLVVASFVWPEGGNLAESAFAQADLNDKKYGVDYVNLGFLPGDEVAIAAFVKDIRSVYSRDFYGTPLDKLQIMQGINSISDFTVAIPIIQAGPDPWVRQISPYKTLILFVGGAGLADSYVYYQAGQIYKILSGLNGGAQYESLIERPGWGLKSSAGLSIGMYSFVAAEIAGNLLYFRIKAKAEAEAKEEGK